MCIDYTNGKYIIRDSRLDNATDTQIHLIAKEYSNKTNHYVFIYSPLLKQGANFFWLMPMVLSVLCVQVHNYII